MYSGSPCRLSTTTWTSGQTWRSCSVACAPPCGIAIHHHDIGSAVEGLLDRRAAIGRLSDHLHVWLRLDQQRQPVPHDGVIVGENDPQFTHRYGLLASGGGRESE